MDRKECIQYPVGRRSEAVRITGERSDGCLRRSMLVAQTPRYVEEKPRTLVISTLSIYKPVKILKALEKFSNLQQA